MSAVQSTTIPIAGLAVDVYNLDAGPAVQDVAIVLLLHGRTGSAKSEYVKIMINSVLKYYDEQRRSTSGSPSERGLVIVAFDHRNHGSRLVHEPANHAWVEREDMPNPKHMVDQYALQVGAARDVSFLIDFLPSYLYPNGERNVLNWGVIGLSLGGDACWIALKDDPRINLGIPVIACPDYIGVMEFRAKQSRIPTSPPSFPDSLRRFIQQHDVLATSFNQNSPSNPFLGKHILVLSVGEDTLVPFERFCKPFVDGLEVGSEGTKRVVVQPGVGHEITDDMREEVAKFVWSWVTKA